MCKEGGGERERDSRQTDRHQTERHREWKTGTNSERDTNVLKKKKTLVEVRQKVLNNSICVYVCVHMRYYPRADENISWELLATCSMHRKTEKIITDRCWEGWIKEKKDSTNFYKIKTFGREVTQKKPFE